MVKFKYYKNLLKKIILPRFDVVKEIFIIILCIFIFGFILNLIVNYFFDFVFNIKGILSFGFIWYLISDELPNILEKYRGRQ